MADVGERRRTLALPLFLLVLVVALWWPALRTFFSTDDLLFLLAADGHADWPAGMRRLLSVRLFFSACWRLFGANPLPYHAVILAVHWLSALLVWRLARGLGLTRRGAEIAAILFAAAPAAFTCLHWISGVQEVAVACLVLLAALSLLRGRPRWDAAALVLYALALLAKESAVLALPVLALTLPAPPALNVRAARRRRLRLALLGLAVGVPLLVLAGALRARPAGDPYATAYGANLLWNLLTYLAWLVRPWDWFPDRVPEYQPQLWAWGLVLPALLGLAAWRRRDWARAIGRAGLLFFALLLPVLPLVRHSYLYYLYLPLVPLWLLAAAGLDRLPARRAWLAWAAVAAVMVLAAWQGASRRGAVLSDQLRLDPVLRYGDLARTAVETLRAADEAPRGRVAVLTPFPGGAVDLAEGLRSPEGARRVQFLPVAAALRGGEALRVFFPRIEEVRFPASVEEIEDWDRWRWYWTFGAGNMDWLGQGEAGRHALARLYYRYHAYRSAAREVDALLARHPGDADLLYDRALVALQAGDRAGLDELLAALRARADAESIPGPAARAYREFLANTGYRPADR
ncbi:MAG: hypothetical protein JW819_07585 [Candidatus Krumholzibacteriota bacterium]|nr:hypothetical protein [Candidatus Krumholzibacteriota bacterium]